MCTGNYAVLNLVSSKLLQNWVNSCLRPHTPNACSSLVHTHTDTASTGTYPCRQLAWFFEWKTSDTGHWTPSNKALWDIEGHDITCQSNIPYRWVWVCTGRNTTSLCMCKHTLICSDSSKCLSDVTHFYSGRLSCCDTVIKWELFPLWSLRNSAHAHAIWQRVSWDENICWISMFTAD